MAMDTSRREFNSRDVFLEIWRVKGLIDSGFFGPLEYDQIGKLHVELHAIEETYRTFLKDQKIGPVPVKGGSP